MLNVTQILSKIETGDRQAASELLPVVYEELRKLAAAKMIQERPDHTLQATALVHEAYVRLVDVDEVQGWESRGHFFSAAAEAMRRILIDSARSKQSQKRGGDIEREDGFDFEHVAGDFELDTSERLLEVDDALEKLEPLEPKIAKLVRLRLYAGLSNQEAANVMGISRSTAKEYWRFACAWFSVELEVGD